MHLGGAIHLKGCVYLEHTQFSCLWIVCKLCNQRACGMPPCGPSTKSRSSRKLKKLLYCGSQCYLPRNHSYRKAWVAFNGGRKLKTTPTRVTVTNIIQWGTEWESWLHGPRNKTSAKLDPVHKLGIKWISIMFQLPFWEVKIVGL